MKDRFRSVAQPGGQAGALTAFFAKAGRRLKSQPLYANVQRDKALAAKGFYGGLSFFSVKSHFAAITDDPTGTGKGGSRRKIVAEFTRTLFVAGSVGMVRDPSDLNSVDSQFFVGYKDLPQLVGKYTKRGQVFSGLEHVRGLARGRPLRGGQDRQPATAFTSAVIGSPPGGQFQPERFSAPTAAINRSNTT